MARKEWASDPTLRSVTADRNDEPSYVFAAVTSSFGAMPASTPWQSHIHFYTVGCPLGAAMFTLGRPCKNRTKRYCRTATASGLTAITTTPPRA